MFPLFETIRIQDGVPQHLEWHQERFERSCRAYFKKTRYIDIQSVIAIPDKYREGVVKCRFSYDANGFSLSFQNYTPKIVRTFQLVFDDVIDYRFKYTNRQSLAKLLERRSNCDEIIIVKNDFITDTSYSNLVFFDGYHWHTPVEPLLMGTNRARLINQGLVKESLIKVENLPHFSGFKMINAMLDFNSQPMIDIAAIKH